jgi:hypothetical protein
VCKLLLVLFGAAQCLGVALLLTPVVATGQELFPQIHLSDIGQGQGLSSVAQEMAVGGYELAGGEWVSFREWYSTDWPEMHVEMLAQFSKEFGLLVGAGTGEAGEKYNIAPSLRLGFIAQTKPSEKSTLTLTVRSILGGALTESSCIADYGVIGGRQEVNCRLAAGLLPPDETLDYLAFVEPNRLRLTLDFRARF